TLTGTGGGSGSSLDDYGVEIDGSTISTVNGNITITGTGGGTITGGAEYGIYTANAGSTIKTTGSGNITVTGIDTHESTPFGIEFTSANSVQTTGIGNITVNADTIALSAANAVN